MAISDANVKVHQAARQVIRLVKDNADVVEISERLEAIEHMAIADIVRKMYGDAPETLKKDLAKLALAGSGENVPKKSAEYMLWYSVTRYFDGDYALLLDTIGAIEESSLGY